MVDATRHGQNTVGLSTGSSQNKSTPDRRKVTCQEVTRQTFRAAVAVSRAAGPPADGPDEVIEKNGSGTDRPRFARLVYNGVAVRSCKPVAAWIRPFPKRFSRLVFLMTKRTTAFSFWIVLSIAPWFVSPCFATRLIAFTPQSTGSPPAASPQSPANAVVAVVPGSQSGDQAWSGYLDAWRQHANDPADAGVRQRLGLPAQEPVSTKVIDSRSLNRLLLNRLLPKGLQVDWIAPQGIETENFLLIADVPTEVAIQVAIDLESFYAVWTQLFFPLWKDRQRWDQAQRLAPNRQPVPRGSAGNKMRVLVFRDSAQYQKALKAEGPQIGQSTGYYSGNLRTTFLLHSARDGQSASADEESRATRYHELTHQMLAEATDTKLKVMPGERSGFWLAEGIACYMESTSIQQGYATVGGWESSRLQFARHRVLSLGESASIDPLRMLGRVQFQRHVDLPSLYAMAAAETHRMIDRNDGDGLNDMISQLAQLYQIRRPSSRPGEALEQPSPKIDLTTYLKLTDESLSPLNRDDLINLCLARCELTGETLARISPQKNLAWLDLTAINVSSADVARLCPQSTSLRQLSLEATAVDDTLAVWIAAAHDIEEIDLSWTGVSDATVNAVPATAPLHTLWLTGSEITDASIDRIAAWRSLRRVDTQRTGVTDAGRARLASLRPDLTIDPLELVPAK